MSLKSSLVDKTHLSETDKILLKLNTIISNLKVNNGSKYSFPIFLNINSNKL